MVRSYVWITRSRGKRKKRIKVPDRGKRGLTPRRERWFRARGSLYGWCKDLSASARYAAIMRSVRAEGVNTTKRKLISLANVTADPATRRLARDDFRWLRRKYPPKSGRRK